MTFFQEERALLLACHCRDDRRLSQQDSRGGRPRHHLQCSESIRPVRLTSLSDRPNSATSLSQKLFQMIFSWATLQPSLFERLFFRVFHAIEDL